MAKDPDDRYGTAGGLVRAAHRAMESGSVGRSGATGGLGQHTLVMPPDATPTGIREVPAAGVGNRHRRTLLLPVAVAVATALLLAGVAAGIGLLTRQKGEPAPPSPQVTAHDQTGRSEFAAGDDPPFRGFVLQRPSLEVRSEPALSAPVTGYLPYESEVFIVCTTIGDLVDGPGAGGGPSIVTPVWDKVRTAVDGTDIGFVPDAWVKTGTAEPQAATCQPER
jgi:hypothetical protein